MPVIWWPHRHFPTFSPRPPASSELVIHRGFPTGQPCHGVTNPHLDIFLEPARNHTPHGNDPSTCSFITPSSLTVEPSDLCRRASAVGLPRAASWSSRVPLFDAIDAAYLPRSRQKPPDFPRPLFRCSLPPVPSNVDR